MPAADPDALLEPLDPEQREVAAALRGPVRVLAGAGTGKTRAITHRIAYGVASGVYVPTEVLAVTFTTRAAGELRGRLRDLGAPGVQARTFHSAALRQARYFWPRVYGGDLPTLTESKLGLLGSAARRCRVSTETATLRDLAGEVEWAKVGNVRAEGYEAAATRAGRSVAGLAPAEVARVLSAYEETKRDQGRMDMEDVLLVTAALLADVPEVATQVRRQYRWFVVDEFQDVSPIQASLLRLWLGDRQELCVVGDPSQTIYSFAGADAGFLRDFPKAHPDTRCIDLVRNYRSSPQIVSCANRLLQDTPSAGVRLVAQRDAGPHVEFTEHADEVAEAETVATRVQTLQRQGTPLREVAVLYRVNAQSQALEDALAARSVPYTLRGAARFFDRAEVREAVTRLRGAARAGDTTAADGGSGGLVDEVTAVLAAMGWEADPPSGRGNVRDRWESLAAIRSQAEDHAHAADQASLAGFVADLDRRAHEQHAPVADGVTLATLHAAKGLEWDHVFCCGVHEGTLPLVHADTAASVEEERRLLYVGLTRARRTLEVSWSTARSPGGRATRGPSRFLAGVRPEGPGETRAGRRGKTQRPKGVPRCRLCGVPLQGSTERKLGRCGTCPADYDEELFGRLRDWRASRAAAEKVPAFVVFTDATLTAIAEVRPETERALLRVNGVGRTKLERYGADVLALCHGREPESGPPPDQHSDMTRK